LGKPDREGEIPVREMARSPGRYLSTAGHEKPCRKPGRPRSKAKYEIRPIEQKYREGKAKRTPARGVKQNLKPQTRNMSKPGRLGDGVPFVE
jgi:hypothetical protein